MKSLCDVVVYKVLKLKFEIDLAFFLPFTLFKLSDNWKRLLQKSEFLTA